MSGAGTGMIVSQFKPPDYTQEDWHRYLSGDKTRAASKCEYCGRYNASLENCAGCGAAPKVGASIVQDSSPRSDDDDALSPSIALAGMGVASSFPDIGASVSGESFSGGGGDFGGGGATGSWDSGS